MSIVIKDLDINKELDRKAMLVVIGGYSYSWQRRQYRRRRYRYRYLNGF